MYTHNTFGDSLVVTEPCNKDITVLSMNGKLIGFRVASRAQCDILLNFAL